MLQQVRAFPADFNGFTGREDIPPVFPAESHKCGLGGVHRINRRGFIHGAVRIAIDEKGLIFQDSDPHGARTTVAEPIVLNFAGRLAARIGGEYPFHLK